MYLEEGGEVSREMAREGVVPPDDVKLLADVLSEYCSTANDYDDGDREYLALRLLTFYRCGHETPEALLSKLEAEREKFDKGPRPGRMRA